MGSNEDGFCEDYRSIGFSNCNSFSEDSVQYVVHESGTSVYDRNGKWIGEFPTETEAKEHVRELRQKFFLG